MPRMPSRGIAVGIGAVLVAAAVVIAVFALVRDEAPPGRGDLIAYGCREQNKVWYAVCVIRVDGTDREQLTTRLPTSGSAWSPNGRRIAFTRHELEGEFSTFTDDDVFVMDARGGDVRQLTVERPGTHSGQPTWSPDVREIAFVRGPSLAAGIAGQPGSVFIMAADGSGVRRLTRGALDSGPSWSPNGRELAFSRAKDFSDPSREIWVVDVAGGEPRELTHTADYFDTHPAWSPDGGRIAFSRARPQSEFDGRSAIYVMNRDGTGLELLVRFRRFARAPQGLTWSPDGRTIAFETSPNRECTAISLVDVGSGAVRPLTSCTRPRESAVSPAWQPDADAGDS